MAIDADSKLIPSYLVGKRDLQTATNPSSAALYDFIEKTGVVVRKKVMISISDF